jgi:hypothetical protein
VHLLFRLRRLRHGVTTEARRLLRVLFVRIGAVPAYPGGAAVLWFAEVEASLIRAAGTREQGEHAVSAACEECEVNAPGDWARGTRLLLIWCVPGVILLLSALIAGPYRVIVWPTLLTWMGWACLINARRCRRLHCYLTAPYFLFLALISLLHGSEVLPLGPRGWLMLSIALVAGGPFLVYVPERVFGRYRMRTGVRQQ